jgi:hypothetical protein
MPLNSAIPGLFKIYKGRRMQLKNKITFAQDGGCLSGQYIIPSFEKVLFKIKPTIL